MTKAQNNIKITLLTTFLRLKKTSSTAYTHAQHALKVKVSFMMPEPQKIAEGMNRKAMANWPDISGK
jgi:endo-beta-N-acetylglucosaminidase D